MAGSGDPILVVLAVITGVLVTAHALGLLADRLGFVPVVGELLTGLVLGPSMLGAVIPAVGLLLVPVPIGLELLASLGLVLLLVLAGTEVDLDLVRVHWRPTVAIAVGGSIVPFVGGFGLGWVLPTRFLVDPSHRLIFALFLATALSISAVPVAMRVLVDLGAIDHSIGQLTLTAAVAIDAAGWIVLTLVSDLARVGRIDRFELLATVGLLVGFVVVTAVIGPVVVDRLFGAADSVRSPVVTGFAIVIVTGFGMAAVSIALGLEAVLGAFLAGVVVSNRLDAETTRVFQVVTLGLFAPLFFATAGLRADLSGVLTADVALVGAATLAVAILGKGIGVAIGAGWTSLTREETVCIAIGLNARGAMEIVVAALGLGLGILTPAIYTVIVLVAIVTSVMTPPLLRRAIARLGSESPPGRAISLGRVRHP